jgi:RNA polymerase sigma-70 factor (ECF subfamily)
MDGEREKAPRTEEDRALRSSMERYQRGEMDAFEDLYRKTVPMLRGYFLALTRDPARSADLVQETYLQTHRSRRTYDPAYPVKPWLLAIARHVRLTDERARGRRSRRELTGFDELPDVPVPAEMEALGDRDALERALAAVPADRREALLLHHVHGLSFREVGRVVGVSEGGARIRASRGMADLRAALRGGGTGG